MAPYAGQSPQAQGYGLGRRIPAPTALVTRSCSQRYRCCPATICRHTRAGSGICSWHAHRRTAGRCSRRAWVQAGQAQAGRTAPPGIGPTHDAWPWAGDARGTRRRLCRAAGAGSWSRVRRRRPRLGILGSGKARCVTGWFSVGGMIRRFSRPSFATWSSACAKRRWSGRLKKVCNGAVVPALGR